MQPASTVAVRVPPKPARPAPKLPTAPAAKPTGKPVILAPVLPTPPPKPVAKPSPNPAPAKPAEQAHSAAPSPMPPRAAAQKFAVAMDWEGSLGCHVVTASSYEALLERVSELAGHHVKGLTYGPSNIVIDNTPALVGVVEGVAAGTDKGSPFSAPKMRAHLGDVIVSKRKLEQTAYQEMKDGKAS